MKKIFPAFLAISALLFSACDSESSGPAAECTNGDSRDCEAGTDGGAKAIVCVDGHWSEAKQACSGNPVSCTTDGKCGECRDGDTTQCTNGLQDVGKAIGCTNGRWEKEPSYCPGQVSCAMSGDCYQCLSNCDADKTCPAECTDSDCEEICRMNAACKAECNKNHGGCESKCGECVDGDMLNCKEDNDGLGSADYCYNGTWQKNHKCDTIYKAVHNVDGLTVSCTKKCTKICGDTTCCRDDEYISICGECKNIKAGSSEKDLICVQQFDSKYGVFYPDGFSYSFQLVKCVDGKLSFDPNDGYKPCENSCLGQDGYDACKASGQPGGE